VVKVAEAGLQATERGARLTRQLLSFARRQNLRPEIVNPNAVLLGSEALLRRALGETIQLDFSLYPALHPARVDAAEFEAAVLNLVVNARDALPPGGGRIVIATRNAVLSGADATRSPEAAPGDYIVVTVSDDGSGMDADTLARAFEPFFTTKEVGKGSGLGLSQVYGFARASGGLVEIRSVPDEGTAVEIFLPRANASAVTQPRANASAVTQPTSPSGVETGASSLRRAEPGETVLAVEDDPAVLAAVVENLADLGYEVVAAHDAAEALQRLHGTERIDILFSDVVMPGGMNGVQLAAEAARIRPTMKVLLTSGYTGQALAGKEGLPAGLSLLPKPYRREELASRLRLVLKTG
jgi:CheY-like chemotaxis protein